MEIQGRDREARETSIAGAGRARKGTVLESRAEGSKTRGATQEEHHRGEYLAAKCIHHRLGAARASMPPAAFLRRRRFRDWTRRERIFTFVTARHQSGKWRLNGGHRRAPPQGRFPIQVACAARQGGSLQGFETRDFDPRPRCARRMPRQEEARSGSTRRGRDTLFDEDFANSLSGTDNWIVVVAGDDIVELED